MPPLEIRDLQQQAVYWPFVNQDRHANPIVGSASQIQCRMEITRTQGQDAFGNTVAFDGLLVTTFTLVPMSLIWQGLLANLPANNFNPPIYQVYKADITPDLKNRNQRYEYYLLRYGNNLPTVAP